MAVGFGIIGAGRISAKFAEIMSGVEGVELAAVSSADIEKAQALAAFSKIQCRVYSDAKELLMDDTVDVVYVGQINSMHVQAVAAALQHGKAVICEKPMALTESDARKLISLAKENNLLLMEAMWTRCLPAYRKAKELVDGGVIGKVKLIKASFSILREYSEPGAERLYDKALGGGAMFDVGVYPIEFSTGILGNPVTVDGAAVISPTGVDELSTVLMTHENGAMSVSTSGFVVEDNWDAFICGTKGYIAMKDFFKAQELELYNDGKELVESYSYPHSDGFIYQIQHVRDLFLSGEKESGLIPLEDTANCAAIFDAMRKKWGTD